MTDVNNASNGRKTKENEDDSVLVPTLSLHSNPPLYAKFPCGEDGINSPS